jgi:hypothetical protein
MNKNIIFSIVVSIAFFMLSCSQDDLGFITDYDLPIEIPSIDPVIPTTRVVSEDQAEAFANMAIRAILNQQDHPGTRSATSRTTSRVIGEVLPIVTEDGITVMHAINFKDDLGFMILSADKESHSIMLQFSDTLNFNPAVLAEVSPMGDWIRGTKEMIAQEIKEGITDKTIESYQLWGNITGQNEGVEIEIALVSYASTTEGPTTRARRRQSRGLQNVPASYWIARFEWGQGRGYNENAQWSGIHLAGCAAVAIGLICNHWAFPSQFNFLAMPRRVTTHAPNAVSRMFREIADNIPCWEWGRGYPHDIGSHATGPGIEQGLRNLGFVNARFRPYDFNIAYNDILRRRPVLLGGFDEVRIGQFTFLTNGHIWAADGYWEQIWQVTRRVLGIVTSRWYEFECLMFMNWGWDGRHNGWINEASWTHHRSGRVMWHNIYPPGTWIF